MRRNLTAALALILLLSSSGRGLAGGPAPTEAQRTAALKAVKAEKQVKDAMWAEKGMLWAAVQDNGLHRDGYAEYLCMVLSEHGVRGAFVVIKDARKMEGGEFVNLGQCQCPEN